MTKTFSIAIVTLFCSTAWCADLHPLDVKPGQWETTVTGQMTGLPPIPDNVLQQMTPEQRAKVQAMMQGRGGKATVSKNCMTKEKMEKGFDVENESIKSCSRVLVTSSGSKQEIKMECNREGSKVNGTIKIEALDSENIKGAIQMTAVGGEHTMAMNFTFASKWIGAACTDK